MQRYLYFIALHLIGEIESCIKMFSKNELKATGLLQNIGTRSQENICILCLNSKKKK